MLRRPVVVGAPARPAGKAVQSMACLAFVAFLAAAFWSGAVWIGSLLVHLLMGA